MSDDSTVQGERLVLEELRDAGSIAGLVPEWRRLAATAARSPFESPDWLVPWWGAYGAAEMEPRLLAWRAGGRLAAVAPLARRDLRRFGRPIRELAFWAGGGSLLSGCVDLLAAEADRPAALAELGAWLRAPGNDWDVLHFLRLPYGSSSAVALRAWADAAPWRYLSLTGAFRSETFTIDLPADAAGWHGHLGPKARHNMRREVRLFARQRGGTIERVVDATAAVELVAALERLMGRRWGDEEKYFRHDPAFGGFVLDALASMLLNGSAYAFVARDGGGIRACLVNFALAGRAVAVLIGVDRDPAFRAFSLGKNLFDAAIDEAVARGCRSYDFLWVGGYKETFWHAAPRRLESGLVARGTTGALVAAYAAMRRLALPRLARALRRRPAA